MRGLEKKDSWRGKVKSGASFSFNPKSVAASSGRERPKSGTTFDQQRPRQAGTHFRDGYSLGILSRNTPGYGERLKS